MSRADIQILDVRRRLGRARWGVPYELTMFGVDDGSTWVIDHLLDPLRIIISAADEYDGSVWRHASISHPDRMPTYDELQALHRAVWPGGWAYQVFAPPADHVNIHSFALHLWGRPDGSAALPNFGAGGSI